MILVSSNADESQIVDGSFVPTKSTLVNPVNPNAVAPIDVTLDGISICFIDVQP